MATTHKERPRLLIRGAEAARALAYFTLAIWAGTLFFFPLPAFENALDTGTRFTWLSLTFVSALVATYASLTGRDLKVEIAALYPLAAGLTLHFLTRVWFVFYDGPTAVSDPAQRWSSAVLALFAVIILTPRIVELHDRRKQTRLAQAAASAVVLTPAQRAQPGAFPELARAEG